MNTDYIFQQACAIMGKITHQFVHFLGDPPLPALEEAQALQRACAEKHAQLILNLSLAYSGQTPAPVYVTPKGDRRFTGEAWAKHPFYDYLRQAYYVNSEFIQKLAELMPVSDVAQRQRLRFFTNQYVSALSPANFAATNPEVITAALQSNGTSLQKGIANLVQDLNKGRISMTDEAAFAVGKNLAITPGAVVMRNDLIELLHYAPSGDEVYERPLLIVPPCINKFYILDLQAHNSFVRYAVERGFNVFLISWRNADEVVQQHNWDDYLRLGPLAAIAAIEDICGQPELNALGFCVGGTILSSALTVLEAKKQNYAKTLSLLTTLLDFTDTGEIGHLIHESFVNSLRKSIGQSGIFSGKDLAFVFSALRPNELIWNYVANNYLKGDTPPPLDLLYWNSDAVNLAGPFACQYLASMYLENKLKEPSALTMCGQSINLSTLKMPAFIYASREDHIVPWRSGYRSRSILGGKTTFTLGASGHIAGVINPPSQNKRNYWTSSYAGTDPDQWFAQAQEHPGSWWPLWVEWLNQQGDKKIKAPATLGSKRYPALDPAPGTYVLKRL